MRLHDIMAGVVWGGIGTPREHITGDPDDAVAPEVSEDAVRSVEISGRKAVKAKVVAMPDRTDPEDLTIHVHEPGQ